jgi:hypothetical protein
MMFDDVFPDENLRILARYQFPQTLAQLRPVVIPWRPSHDHTTFWNCCTEPYIIEANYSTSVEHQEMGTK